MAELTEQQRQSLLLRYVADLACNLVETAHPQGSGVRASEAVRLWIRHVREP